MSESKELSILVVGAHPDDIEFGCGAILLKEAESGARIHFLVCSLGEAGSNGTPQEREAESRAAAARCGATIDFIECGGDGNMQATPETARGIARRIRETKATVLLAPSLVTNQHPDHSAIGKAVQDAARLARYAGIAELSDAPPHAIASLYFYAITPGAEPREGTPFVFDVSLQVDAWREMMNCHQSQMKTRRYLDLQLSRARTLGLQTGCEYAQALWPNDPVLVNGLNSAPRGIRLF
ncbi:PIG-L family deacetylase [Pelagicoccus enzymogenes]|uniref:PIG-L deacetylase family protein n=1 Tax=Pelagicoccus enzymogenes TaxID=2773457 RepID=UPI00280C9815|nr:PIG-L family deacetylase [Pelagicoccus enzymogenes]MDQ8196913.1 PIG-L family deacetylase [Pelagicoccus enzymogenes]